MTHPLTLTGLAGTALVLALVGPFQTQALLSLPARLFYWGGLTGAGYAIGYVFAQMLLDGARTGPHALRVVLAGLATGAAIMALVIALNLAVFGFLPDMADLPGFAAQVLAISVVVMAVIDMFSRHLAPARARDPAPAPPPILARLPLDKRGPLVALSVEDHYVRVRTTRGEEMVLMRLADAMRETGDTAGAQVHRSHWAAFGQVRGATRQGDRALLAMSAGPDIPVSRSNLHKLKEAGLLPR